MSRMGPSIGWVVVWGVTIFAVGILGYVAWDRYGPSIEKHLNTASDEYQEKRRPNSGVRKVSIGREGPSELNSPQRPPLGRVSGLNDIFRGHDTASISGARYYDSDAVYQFILGQIFERDRSRSDPRAALVWYALAQNNPGADEEVAKISKAAIKRMLPGSGRSYEPREGLSAAAIQEAREIFDCVYMVGSSRSTPYDALTKLAELYESGRVISPVIDDRSIRSKGDIKTEVRRQNLIHAYSWYDVIRQVDEQNNVLEKLDEIELDSFGRMVAKLLTHERKRQLRALIALKAGGSPDELTASIESDAGRCAPVWRTILVSEDGGDGDFIVPDDTGGGFSSATTRARYAGNPFRPGNEDLANALKRGSTYQQGRPDQEETEDNARSWLQTGKAHLARRDIGQAKIAFENAIRIDATSPAAMESQRLLSGLTTTCDYEAPVSEDGDYLRTARPGGGTLLDPRPIFDDIAQLDTTIMQRAMKALGYYGGQPDGVVGPETRRAVKQFQRELNVNETGFLTREQRVQLVCKAGQLVRFPEAQNLLGVMYLRGNLGLRQDTELGVYWLEQSAEQQDGAALYNLGRVYAVSWPNGPEQNLELSQQYFIEAQRLNHPEAAKQLSDIKARMAAGER